MGMSGQVKPVRRVAGVLPALALGLVPLAAGAQEQPLPSVSDYRLPAPSPRATRAAGPVDPSNPVAPTRRAESSPAPSAPASAAASPAPARTAQPSPRPSPRPSPAAAASPSASPSRAAEPRRTAEPPARAEARDRADTRESADTRETAPRDAETPRQEASPSPVPSPAPPAGAASPPVQWNVHSARDTEGNPIWPWLLGIAVLLASNAVLLVLLLRRRQRKADEMLVAGQPDYTEETPAAEPVQPVLPEPAAQAPVPRPPAEPEPPVFPPQPAVAPVPAQPIAELPSRPALELVAKPIEVTLAARQLSATLMNAVLNYELVVTNLSEDTVGPVIIAGDMIGAHASLPTRSQLEITGSDIEPHHRHAVLHPREWAKFSGEFRLPLAAITPIQSGRASLFIPLARFRVEVLRNGAPPLVINRTFVIGETPETPEAALKPFRLDLGPRLYSHIGQREVAATA